MTSVAGAAGPNILFVIADQWRAQAFGFAGDPNVKTPHFDRFERQSVHFPQAVAGMPVCSPTRASLLTGQRPLTHGVFLNDVPLSTERRDAAEGAESARATTPGASANGTSMATAADRRFIPRERRQGFDYWKVLECTHAYNNSLYYADGPEKLKWDGYDAIAQTRDAQSYLRERGESGQAVPALARLGAAAQSLRDRAGEVSRTVFARRRFELRPNVPTALQAAGAQGISPAITPTAPRSTIASPTCSRTLERDRPRGRIRSSSSPPTTATCSARRANSGKQRPWEESARVPMLFRCPTSLGIKPQRLEAHDQHGGRDADAAEAVRACRFRRPSRASISRAHLRGGADPSMAARLCCVHFAPFGEFTRKTAADANTAACARRATLTCATRQGPWLLYDNQADPYQMTNLVGRTAQAALQTRLDAALTEKLKSPGRRFPDRTGIREALGLHRGRR